MVLEIIQGKATVTSRPLPSDTIALNNGGYWPNLAAKPTLRTALGGFTVDPMQPFAAMTHLNFQLIGKSAGRSAAGGGYAANLIYNWIVQPPPIPQPLQPVQPQSNGSQ